MTRLATLFAVLTLVACSGDDTGEDCTEGVFACDGQILQECVDGLLAEVEDCDVAGGTCDAEMGHCMEETMGDMTGMESM